MTTTFRLALTGAVLAAATPGASRMVPNRPIISTLNRRQPAAGPKANRDGFRRRCAPFALITCMTSSGTDSVRERG